MKSMTGYGRASGSYEGSELTVEISSVNRKSLEVHVSLPKDWQGLEQGVVKYVRGFLTRGKVNIYVKYEDSKLKGLSLDTDAVRQGVAQLTDLSKELGGELEITGELLLRLGMAAGSSKEVPDFSKVEESLMGVLVEAIQGLVSMRETEGAALGKDIEQRVETVLGLAKSIEEGSSSVVPHYKEQMLKRLKDADLGLDLADERVLREIALFADKSDITEELVRLKSHLSQVDESLKSKEAIGRKMDFICQEIFRELNTIGSKANYLKITQEVIEAKNEVERVREQVQNIE